MNCQFLEMRGSPQICHAISEMIWYFELLFLNYLPVLSLLKVEDLNEFLRGRLTGHY